MSAVNFGPEVLAPASAKGKKLKEIANVLRAARTKEDRWEAHRVADTLIVDALNVLAEGTDEAPEAHEVGNLFIEFYLDRLLAGQRAIPPWM